MKNFSEVFNKRNKTWNKDNYDLYKESKILKNSIEYLSTEKQTDYGSVNLIIAMEELAELSQSVSKYLRGIRDSESMLNLLEEVADVEIALKYIKQITCLKNEDVLLAKDIKLNRLQSKMKQNKLK